MALDFEDITDEKRLELQQKPSVFVTDVINPTLPKRNRKVPFPYQEEFLDTENRQRVFVAGRQVGKTESFCWLALHRAVMNVDQTVLVFLPSLRQVIEVFRKLKSAISPWLKNKQTKRAYGIIHETMTELHWSNGSRIIGLPAVDSTEMSETIRGYTANTVICDEAAFISDNFYTSILAPMLLTTQGDFVLTGTPWGQSGFLYRKFHNSRWHTTHLSTYECPLMSVEQVEEMKEDMTKLEFQREILGEFTQKENAAFEKEDIDQCIFRDDNNPEQIYPSFNGNRCFLGVDPARYGKDNAVFVSLDDDGNVFDVIVKSKTKLTEIEGMVRRMDNERAYSKIVLDETSMGGGPFDALCEDKRNVEPYTFSLQSKQRAYQLFRKKLEDGWLKLPDDRKLIGELRDLEREETREGNIKYRAPEGGRDDFVDALVLAVWAVFGERYVDRATQNYKMDNRTRNNEGPKAYSFTPDSERGIY